VLSEEACTRSCAALTLELNAVAEWSRAGSEPRTATPGRFITPANVLPMRKQIPGNQPVVTQGNLLRLNAIKVNRQRPLSPSLHESQFRAYQNI